MFPARSLSDVTRLWLSVQPVAQKHLSCVTARNTVMRHSVMRHTVMRHTVMRHTVMRHTVMRHTVMRHTDEISGLVAGGSRQALAIVNPAPASPGPGKQ
jgi:hypothetical protein